MSFPVRKVEDRKGEWKKTLLIFPQRDIDGEWIWGWAYKRFRCDFIGIYMDNKDVTSAFSPLPYHARARNERVEYVGAIDYFTKRLKGDLDD